MRPAIALKTGAKAEPRPANGFLGGAGGDAGIGIGSLWDSAMSWSSAVLRTCWAELSDAANDTDVPEWVTNAVGDMLEGGNGRELAIELVSCIWSRAR